MTYFDFTAYPADPAKQDAIESFAAQINALFVEHGALRVVDAWGQDVPPGKQTDFLRAVAAQNGETTCVGFVEWPDKATRDDAWQRLEADPRMAALDMPFDGKRMIFGGFSAFADHGENQP